MCSNGGRFLLVHNGHKVSQDKNYEVEDALSLFHLLCSLVVCQQGVKSENGLTTRSRPLRGYWLEHKASSDRVLQTAVSGVGGFPCMCTNGARFLRVHNGH